MLIGMNGTAFQIMSQFKFLAFLTVFDILELYLVLIYFKFL